MYKSISKRKIALLLIFVFISFANSSVSAKDYSSCLDAYDVKFYFLDLQISNLSAEIRGCVSVNLEIIDSGSDSLAMELIDIAHIDSIVVNNQRVPYKHSDDFIRLAVNDISGNAGIIEIKIFYSISEIQPKTDRGIATEMLTDGKSITWTLSEPFYSKNWFPCKQVLTDKADSAYLYFTAADSLKVGANGILRKVVPLGNGQNRFEWQTNYPIAYYLLSFAVGDYLDYSFRASVGNSDSVLVQNYLYNDSAYLQENREDIDITAQLISLFSQKFGTYPFANEKYGHCIAPVGGGMEHQTMTTLGNFNFGLVAHELAHQWFGDNVTCSNWQDIWINEGFASYAEYIAYENIKPQNETTTWLTDAYSLAMSEQGGSVHVPDSDSTDDSRIFNYRLSYRKGAYLIHMIRHELNNDELFFNVLKTFQQQYADTVASTEDFRRCLEELSQQNFGTFFNQWYYGEGYPIIGIRWKQANDTLYVYIDQETSFPSKTPFFDIPIDFKVFYLGGDTIIRFYQHTPASLNTIQFNKRVYAITPDPDNSLLLKIRSVERILPDDSVRFSIFPNPVHDMLNVENFDIGLSYMVRIFSAKGELLFEKESAETFMMISFSTYLKGIYQVVVTRENHKEVFKIARV